MTILTSPARDRQPSRASGKLGDTNPTNSSVCPTHGAYSGLICTRCVTTLPPRTGTTTTTRSGR